MMMEEVRVAREDLGSRLRELRRAAGLTQQELAERVGYSRARVAGAESGEGCAALFWTGCDKVLNGGGTLSAGYGAIEELRRRRHAEDAAAARAERLRRVQQSEGQPTVSPSSQARLRDLLGDAGPRLLLAQSPLDVSMSGGTGVAADLLVAAEAVRREVEDTLASGTISSARLDRLGESLACHIRLYTTTAPSSAWNCEPECAYKRPCCHTTTDIR